MRHAHRSIPSRTRSSTPVRPYCLAWLAGAGNPASTQNEILRENLQQLITVTGRSKAPTWERPWSRCRPRSRISTSPTACASSTAEPTRNSKSPSMTSARSGTRTGSGLRRFARRVRNFSAYRHSHQLRALHLRLVLALLITRTDFNVASFMGLIMVIASWQKMASFCSTRTRSFARRQKSNELPTGYFCIARPGPRSHAACGAAATSPIVMTAIAAVCGMLP